MQSKDQLLCWVLVPSLLCIFKRLAGFQAPEAGRSRPDVKIPAHFVLSLSNHLDGLCCPAIARFRNHLANLMSGYSSRLRIISKAWDHVSGENSGKLLHFPTASAVPVSRPARSRQRSQAGKSSAASSEVAIPMLWGLARNDRW